MAIGIGISVCNGRTAPYVPPIPAVDELLLTFTNISDADTLIGGNSSLVADWNTFFTTWDAGFGGFTAVSVVGNVVNLQGGTAISLPPDLYTSASKPLTIVDTLGDVTRLDLSNTSIIDPPVLTGLTALQELYLNNTSITDPPVLTGLIALQQLYLSGASITDPPVLTGLTALQLLDLSGALITDPPVLTGLTALQYLNLSAAITDPPVLTGLIALQQLYLSWASITDPPVLTGLTALQILDLRGVSITDPPVLTGLTALQILDLRGASITDPPVLTGLTSLTWIGFSNCDGLDLSDIDAILGYFSINYPNLLEVYLEQDPDVVPTPATLLAATTANPLATFYVDV
jgi:Leucine-rich repeat (LRR) protein